jgi:hypothetical protein
MRCKSELYQKEQTEIINNIINILELHKKNIFTLYEFDNDKDTINKILELIPNIRKYFNVTCIVGARYPEKIKRPYLSIIKHLLKNKYIIKSLGYTLKINDKYIRTTKYTFIEK